MVTTKARSEGVSSRPSGRRSCTARRIGSAPSILKETSSPRPSSSATTISETKAIPPRFDRALDRLVRVELPALDRPVADSREVSLGDRTRARSRLTHEERLRGDVRERGSTASQLQPARRRDPDHLVLHERVGAHPRGQVHLACEPERHLTPRHALRHPRARADHDVDVHARMTIGEALRIETAGRMSPCRGGGQAWTCRVGVPERLELPRAYPRGCRGRGGVLERRGARLFRWPACRPPVSLEQGPLQRLPQGLEVLVADGRPTREASAAGYGATPPDLDKRPSRKAGRDCVDYARRESHV